MRTILLVSVFAAAFAGCSSSNSSTSSTAGSDAAATSETTAGSSAEKEAFIRKANAACTKIRQPLVENGTAYYKHHHEGDVPEKVLFAGLFKAVYVPAVEQELKEIRRLKAPAGDEAEINAMLAAEEEVLPKVNALNSATSIAEFGSFFAIPDKKLVAYGLTSCAKSS